MSILVQLILWVSSAGGGGALVAYGIFKGFGTRWLDSKFEKRLQDLRHEHERQMEDIRLKASRILDRSVRLSEREFEAVAEAWALTFEAYVQVGSALPGFRRYPDLSRATDEIAQKVAETAGFDDLEIKQLLATPQANRNTYYGERKEAHQLWNAKRAVQEASNYLAKKALFIEKEVHGRMTAFAEEAWNATVDLELVREMRGHGPIPNGIERRDEAFRETSESKIKELEGFVRERFWERKSEEGDQAPSA